MDRDLVLLLGLGGVAWASLLGLGGVAWASPLGLGGVAWAPLLGATGMGHHCMELGQWFERLDLGGK